MNPSTLGLSTFLALSACHPSSEATKNCENEAETKIRTIIDPLGLSDDLKTDPRLLSVIENTKTTLTQVCLNNAESRRASSPMFCELESWERTGPLFVAHGESWDCGNEERPIGTVYIPAGTSEEMKKWSVEEEKKVAEIQKGDQYDYYPPTSQSYYELTKWYIRKKKGLKPDYPITGHICDTSASTPEDANCVWFYPVPFVESPFAGVE